MSKIEPVPPFPLDEFFIQMDGQVKALERMQTEADWKSVSAFVSNKRVRVIPD